MGPALIRTGIAIGALGLMLLAPAAQAATGDGGVYVDVRENDDPDAQVVERWKLYGSSHALVIGIDDYQEAWPRLSNAIEDARQVAKALEARGFQVTLKTNLTSEALSRELRTFYAIKGADPEARLFVWFAGHGHTYDGEGYLVPADAGPPNQPEFFTRALPMSHFGGFVKLARAKHAMAIFDSCFSGTIFTVQRSRPPAAITQATKKPVRQFLTSGDADQKVSDDGTFRRLFLDAITGEEQADANRDGYLTGAELSFYLEDRLTNLTQGYQTPRSGKLRDRRFDQGDFVFVLPQAQAPQGASAGEETQADGGASIELVFWDSVKDSAAPEDYQAYLEAYPDGSFAPLARARLKRLGPAEVAETEASSQVAALPSPAEEAPKAEAPGAEAPEPEANVEPEVSFQVSELQDVMVAAKNANVRAEPTTKAVKVASLKAGTSVDVSGKTTFEGQDWFRVDRDGATLGYVYGTLLRPPQPLTELEKQIALAEAGDPLAQAALGRRFSEGDGVRKNHAKALFWYRKAAQQGEPAAQTNLAFAYYNGRGVEKDLAKAVMWLSRAADNGQREAQFNLGRIYESGTGVTKDLEKAAGWYRKAAAQGLAAAKKRLRRLEN